MTTMELLKKARGAKGAMALADTELKNRALMEMARALEDRTADILAANVQDLEAARGTISEVMLDRLALSPERIAGMAQGMREVAALPDPVGAVLSRVERPNGLVIEKTAVPMGVIAIIYESRPNVTSDAAALALKAGSACVLRGGKEAHRSAAAIVAALKEGLAAAGLPEDALQLVEDTSRDTATQMMKLNGYLDVLIPRGGAGLIRSVVMNATVPVIETGTGNCHVYVDATADLEMAKNILVNAKCQRPSVCNAAESLLVHKDVAEKFLPMAAEGLAPDHVAIHGCPRTMDILGDSIAPATDEDYGREYLGYEISCKVVDSLDEAIEHINRFNTGHSECIVTRDYDASQRFLEEVDAAAVYVNASTRFTDGFEFGFGAEIGISTQKLHARGPMGLTALTTTKYIIYGNGQVR